MTKLTCIVCPRGCTMEIDTHGECPVVHGNACKRGEQFALTELTEPMRTICSTVKTSFSQAPVLPVRVSADIPKDKIFDVMQKINAVTVHERIGIGDKVIENVCDLGVDVIATSNILFEQER